MKTTTTITTRAIWRTKKIYIYYVVNDSRWFKMIILTDLLNWVVIHHHPHFLLLFFCYSIFSCLSNENAFFLIVFCLWKSFSIARVNRIKSQINRKKKKNMKKYELFIKNDLSTSSWYTSSFIYCISVHISIYILYTPMKKHNIFILFLNTTTLKWYDII